MYILCSEGLHFDSGGNSTVEVGKALSNQIGELLAQTKNEGRGGLRSCALFDVGSSKVSIMFHHQFSFWLQYGLWIPMQLTAYIEAETPHTASQQME